MAMLLTKDLRNLPVGHGGLMLRIRFVMSAAAGRTHRETTVGVTAWVPPGETPEQAGRDLSVNHPLLKDGLYHAREMEIL